MVDFGANLYNTLPGTLTGGNSLPASNFTHKQGDESTQGGNSLRTVTQQFREQAGISDFSPPPKGQEGFASLGPVLKKFQPDITPLHELSGPTSWERLLEEQKRISEAREQAAREAEERISERNQAQDELEDILSLSEEDSRQAEFESNIPENIPGTESEDTENNSNTAQDVINSLSSENEEPENETVPLPGQGARIEEPYRPEDETFEDQSESSENSTPLPGSGSSSEQQQVARLFSTANNTGNAINYFA